ncbi:hypothetical protein B0T22DRAFT_472340 [Podospora appendiculata]|uniref:Uncharacterized protein n=1 Tax=Podospora appendiculata TaxID=314037 RepID=A0AAE1C8M2_9PEZI|nr:hypothetical protein B0T22DRAFT_472340 [Podospora appendiculata]
MNTEHIRAVPAEQLPILSAANQRMMLEPMSCPLCAFSVDEASFGVDEHITQHLHQFAMNALPQTAQGNEESSSHNSPKSLMAYLLTVMVAAIAKPL